MESGVSSEVAEARWYRTVDTKAELKRIGFAPSQLIVPTLLIPIYDVHGQRAFFQHRPDDPRVKDGKPVKYETPRGARMAIDVPPSVRNQLKDPTKSLFITEG